MDTNLPTTAKAPMIALIQTKNIMNDNNLKTKTKRAAALLLMLALLAPLAAWAQNPDCNGPIAIFDDAPYIQDFEDGMLPDCWNVYALEGSTAPYVSNYGISNSGSYSLYFGQTDIYAVLPEFNVPLNLMQISFWVRSGFERTAQLQLGYITAEDDGTCNTFTAIAYYTINPNDGWAERTNYLFNVPATAHRLAFKVEMGLDVFIDDVEVAIPTLDCYPLGTLGLRGVASNAAYLSWELMDNSQTSWDVQVATDANFTENVANLEADSHENYLVEGLDPDTYYYVRVKPSCSDDLWSNTIQFWTMPPCNGPITVTADAPYTEGFENPEGTHENELGRLPACWESYTTGSVGPHNATPGSSLVHGGTQSLSFRSITRDDTYAILPEFSNSLNELQISFWLRCGWGRLQLGYLTADDEGNCNTFTTLADFDGPYHAWTQHIFYLLNVPEAAHRLAFKWSESAMRGFIDDVEVSICALDCFPVGNLSVEGLSSTSAYLSWELFDDSQTAWNVQLATDAAFSNILVDEETDSHENYLLSGLNGGGTQYYVRVKPTCNTDLWNAIGFTTLCGSYEITLDAPYTQGFESPEGGPYNIAGSLPDCWLGYRTSTVEIRPHSSNTLHHDGLQSLAFYSYGDPVYAILPHFSNPLSDLQISFWMMKEHGTLVLGYLTDEDDGTCNTFTEIASYTHHYESMVQHTTYLPHVPATAHRLAFKWSSTSNYYCFVDDVEVKVVPPDFCYPVGNMSVGEVTTTSAYLSWELINDNQTAWEVQVATDAAFTENLVDYVADSHENYLVEGLSHSTCYYVRVRANCDDTHQSEWSNAFDFTTLCELIEVTADAPYTQGFENPEGTLWTRQGTLPPCWEGYNNTDNPAPHNTIGSEGAPNYVHGGTQSLSFYNGGGGDVYAVLPEFSNPLDELQISFWMATSGNGSGQLHLGYLTAEDDGTCNTFTEIATYYNIIGFMMQRTTYLPNVPATAHRLAFKWSAAFYRCFVDDLVVSLAPECYPVGNLSVGEVSNNSAYLSWDLIDDSQEAWNLQVATDAVFTDTVAEYVADSHENYLIDGLSDGTKYYVRVKPICNTDLWNTINFTTECEPFTVTDDAPYTQGFESPEGTLWTQRGPLPPCWEGYNNTVNPAPHNTIWSEGAPNYVHSGAQSLSFYNGGDAYAVLPEFTNPINGLQISFWMGTDGNGSGQLRLGYLTAEDNGTCNTFTEIADYGSNHESMVQRSTTLENVPATAHRLAFKWSATSSYRCFVDDVEVSLNLALKPTDLTCTEVTSTSATLTWTSNAESWQIMLNDDETNLIMADTNPFTLTGLVPETFYTAKVRSYWDSDNQSEWSDPVSFTNNGICPEGMVCIGNGTQTNNNLPTSNYYKYGLTQQIYTADEIGQAGCITSIEFFKASAYTMTRNLDIYLVCTDKDEFENTSDWIPVTANDLVFSGTVTFADQDWTTITLDVPFNYYGTSNVAVVVDDNTGGFSYSLPFHVFSTEKEQTIFYCDSNNNYDPTASPGNAINTISEKNRIRLGMEELPGCERPTLLAVDTLGATSATLSWTENGEATAWQIMLNDDHTNLIEADSNPFTLDSLIPETIYTAKVRAHCPDGNGISLWSSPISFNPTRAFTIGAGTATNNDLPTNNFYKYSYTQQIYTTEELGEAGLIERIDFFKNSTAACNRNLDIYLVSTDKSSFDGGNDWIVTTEEDLVFSGTVSFVDKAWTIITFDKPFIYNGLHNVAIIVDDHTGSYVSRTPFLVFDAPNQALSTYHDKGEKAVLGQKNQIRVLKSAMGDCINPTMLTASELNYYDATLTWEENGTSTEWVVDYWYLNSSNEEVHNQLTVADSTHCHIENLSDNTEYHAKVRPACDENKWSNTVVFTTLEACSVPVITLGTVTATTAELSWNGLSEGYTVMYRESIVRVVGEWQTLSVDEAAVTLNNLVPEADYEVKVIPSCDETKESPILTFTTANPCEAPTNLAVGNITTTTAEISWDGISLSGYEVEYYTATLIDTLLSEGFESGELPQGWTIEGDSQDPTKTWRVGAGDDQASTGTHSGDYNALIMHNNRDEVTYLIMPAFDLGDYDNAQLSFWYVNRNWASDIDELGVFYRIGTEGEWNELWSTADAHATWTNQTLALTGLADNYQIGFRMIDHWGRGVGLDDIVVFHELAPAGEPMTLTVVEGTTATLTGLADNTTYEARVKANCYEAEYSQPVGFTTPACPAPVATLGTVTATTAELSWTASLCEGYTVKYREIPVLLEEHFDGDDVPEGWAFGNMSDFLGIVNTNFAGIAANEVILTGNNDDLIFTPAIDLSGISEVQLSFNFATKQRDVDFDNLFEIVIKSFKGDIHSMMGTWETIGTWSYQNNKSFHREHLSVTTANSHMGQSDVRFEFLLYNRTNSSFMYLDDIVIEGSGGEWQTLSVADTAVTLTNLSPNTEYEVKVVPDCDENKESELLTFTTAGMETFTKEIVGYGESNGGYYLIASPVVEPIMPSEENGFLTNAFDLYRFNQNGVNALEWENWKAEENYHYPIENGRGYLYASHDSTTLTFSGTPYSGNGQVTLTKTDGVTFEGWNLVGNPFPTMAFIDDGRPFYTVNGDGSQIIGVVGHSVEVMEAIFVVAEEDGETMTFTTEMPALGASLSLNVMAAEPSDTPTHRAPTVIDRAIIRFGEGRQLPKFQLNGNSTKVYIPQGGMDYAVVCSEGKGELPLNFKAAKNGTYTLSVNMENMEFDYLHLIDNLTGADIDLLAVESSVPEPVEGPNATGTGPSTSSGTSYTFTAKTTDYESRFKLVFSADEDVCEPNEAFAYINNGNIVITTDMGDATLQIVDVMGRVVASYSGHTRCVSTSGMTAGVYVLRLVGGEMVRTQKIVVGF